MSNVNPDIVGVHHVKFPVSDLERSRIWYEEVFGCRVELEFRDEPDGPVRGLAFEPISGVMICLRENAAAAAGIAGFDPVSFAIRDRASADRWVEHLDRLGIDHSPVIDATIGWLVVFHDPDGVEHHLYSVERHGIDQGDRPGYGVTRDDANLAE